MFIFPLGLSCVNGKRGGFLLNDADKCTGAAFPVGKYPPGAHPDFFNFADGV